MILGIDPGLRQGALASLWAEERIISFADIPVAGGQVDAANLARMIAEQPPTEAVLELVGPMPKEGVSSVFKFGQSVGVVLGVLAALRVPVTRVTPSVWKKAYGIGKDKDVARRLAIQQWPDEAKALSLKKHAGRAEAGLMALWRYRQIAGDADRQWEER
jgi:crossover junction endodeoxyribonuclease RuvC